MINLFDKNAIKILTIFSTSPGSNIDRKLLKEKTGLNNIILDKTLFYLLNINLLIKNKRFISLNFENKDMEKIINLVSEKYLRFKHLPFKQYFMILDIKNEILRTKNVGEIFLFGSYSKLIFKEDSDIDIAIVSDEIDKREISKLIKKLEKKFKKNIEIHIFSKNFYKNKKDPLVKNILKDGIKLNE